MKSTEIYSSRNCPEKRKVCHVVQVFRPSECNLIFKFSSLSEMLEITAWCINYVSNLFPEFENSTSNTSEVLQAHDIKQAEIWWTKHFQQLNFPEEYSKLSEGLKISNKSPLLNLNVFYDKKSCCLQVNGRLRYANLSPDEKFPLVLYGNSKFAQLLIEERHLKSLHSGTQLTLSYLRETHWLINGRKFDKSFISKCLTCVRYRAASMQQQMAQLPARVNPSPPFTHVGVDYAGPLKIKMSLGRGHKSGKGYIVVFVCFCTKAVHLEAVTSYDSSNFLNAFKRFVSRRGLCSHVYSDCGTNFVGADTQLKHMFSQDSDQTKQISDALAKMGIQWHFNPPAAPHFGGLWRLP